MLGELWRLVGTGDFWSAVAITMRRVVLGFAAATVIGLLVGVATVRIRPLRVAIGSLITGLQTMPSIAWFPLAILLFQLPRIVSGLKQGWAFAWRSLTAGELLVTTAAQPSLGVELQFSRELNDAEGLIATMIVILVIGILVDMVFGRADAAIRRRWGVLDAS